MMPEISLNILDVAQNSITAGAALIEISVIALKSEDTLTVVIEDNGCGMNEEQVKRVTDPFYTTRKTRKVGLGIPFFKLACEQAGGEFQILSVVDVGTELIGSLEVENIDRLPLGDLGETMVFLISAAPDIRFVMTLESVKDVFEFDTNAIKEEIGDVPITEYEILQWIKEFVNENVQIIFGGVLNEIIG